MSDSITKFEGENRFLSNFGAPWLIHSENLFQAAKATKWDDMLFVLGAPTPGEAKNRGRRIKKRDDWDEIKEDVMWCVLQIKFAPGTESAKKLQATGDAELIEGNWWGDQEWGCTWDADLGWTGQNLLGKLLMAWRDELNEMELDSNKRSW